MLPRDLGLKRYISKWIEFLGLFRLGVLRILIEDIHLRFSRSWSQIEDATWCLLAAVFNLVHKLHEELATADCLLQGKLVELTHVSDFSGSEGLVVGFTDDTNEEVLSLSAQTIPATGGMLRRFQTRAQRRRSQRGRRWSMLALSR